MMAIMSDVLGRFIDDGQKNHLFFICSNVEFFYVIFSWEYKEDHSKRKCQKLSISLTSRDAESMYGIFALVFITKYEPCFVIFVFHVSGCGWCQCRAAANTHF